MDPPRSDLFSAIQSNGEALISAAALEALKTAPTDYMCYEIVYHDLVESKVIGQPSDKTVEQRKSVDESNTYSLQGDNAVVAKDLQRALLSYSKSIAAAPYPMYEKDVSTELAVGFGKRSAVYMEMKKYEAAMKDISNALLFHYPDHLKYKLLTKRFECLLELGMLDEAEKSLNEAGNLIQSDPNSQQESRDALLFKANKLLLCTIFFKKMLKNQQNKTEKKETGKMARQKPQLKKTYGEHPEIPAASNCLKIEMNQTFGRHLVSTRDINPGDIIMIEKPYICTLLPESYDTHCYNCLQRSDAMIPCKQCALVMFCSAACREAAWSAHHDIECPVLPFVNLFDVDYIPPLALRMLVTATKTVGHGSLWDLFHKVCFIEENGMFFGAWTGFDPDLRYLSTSYLAAHLLCRNTELNLSYHLVAALIVDRLARRTGLFRPRLAPPPTAPDLDWGVFAGGLLTFYADVVSTNGFATVEHCLLAGGPETRTDKTGCGVYNTLALLNHSCFNNVQTFVAPDGMSHVLYALRPIRKGEQLFTNYGCYFAHKPLAERKAELNWHYFTCRCVACRENWPTDRALPLVKPTVLCCRCRRPLSSSRCPQCRTNTDVCTLRSRLAKLHSRALRIRQEMYAPSCLDIDYGRELTRGLGFVTRHFRMPCITVLLLQDTLAEFLFSRMGNHYTGPTNQRRDENSLKAL